MTEILEDLAAAADKLREADQRRKNQRDYVDHLISKAKRQGIGWAEIKRATRMHNRSIQLAIERASKR